MSARRGLVVVVAMAALLSACGDDSEPSGSSSGDVTAPTTTAPTTSGLDSTPDLAAVDVTLTAVATADQPVGLTHRPGDPDDILWVVGQTGTVSRVELLEGAVAEADGRLDLADRISRANEQGLLGLAFSPDGEHLYVNLTDVDGATNLLEFSMAGDAVDDGSERTVLVVEQPFDNHNGGHLAFGPDGYLYIGLGDGGAAGDPTGNGQDPSTLLGSMLRIDPAGTGDGDYTIPDDNPFVGGAGPSGARPEVWAYGLRNPWRYSFDPATGDLWIGDVGQNTVEEIDRLSPEGGAGANFGWAEMEGSRPHAGGSPPPGAVPPVLDYTRDAGGCSVTGGYVYRGSAIPDLVGAYVYGDVCLGEVRALTLGAGVVEDRGLGVGGAEETLVSFGQGGDRELYTVSIAGEIHRLDPAP